MPVIDDYYEPFTYRYLDLIESPASDVQPTAASHLADHRRADGHQDGAELDDDLSGTPDYARNDPNFKDLSPEQQEAMFEMERLAFFYLPRICNHCLNRRVWRRARPARSTSAVRMGWSSSIRTCAAAGACA